jgi:hypothetical protein
MAIERRNIVPIVEGLGDEKAVPVLLRRLLHIRERYALGIANAKKAKSRQKLVDNFEQFLEYSRKESATAAVLVLLDADKDCPYEIAVQLAQRARALNLPFPVVIVCANCEYEVWFLASLETIAGQPINGNVLFPDGLSYSGPVEQRRGVKEWLKNNMLPGHTYKETQHQETMSSMIDFDLVRPRSRSFRRLEHAVDELLHAIDNQHATVTPLPAAAEVNDA